MYKEDKVIDVVEIKESRQQLLQDSIRRDRCQMSKQFVGCEISYPRTGTSTVARRRMATHDVTEVLELLRRRGGIFHLGKCEVVCVPGAGRG